MEIPQIPAVAESGIEPRDGLGGRFREGFRKSTRFKRSQSILFTDY